jgi:predicted O-methyltransferase YrrM
LHLIDHNLLQKVLSDRFAAAIDRGPIRLHKADSVDALQQFSDSHFDWIYIDADHSYEGVRRDLGVAKMKVKRDGLLVLNDHIFWSHREFMAYGVVQAVNELCLSDDWEFAYLALHPEMYGDVVLRKP